MANTAMAAKFVAESGDSSKAAIASVETAALYGLEVLVPSINTDGDNTTRFIVLSRDKPTGGNQMCIRDSGSSLPMVYRLYSRL